MKVASFLSGLLMSCVSLATAQTGYTVETFTVPGATDTGVSKINDAGFTVGTSDVLNEDGTYSYAGFLRSPSGQFTTIVPPAALGPTFAYGLNNQNVVVGIYDDTGSYHYVGFSYESGVYRLYTSSLFAINDKRAVLGEIVGGPGPFVRTPDGSFHFFNFPGAPANSTSAGGINNGGDIVGTYVDVDFDLSHGYLIRDQQFASIDYPAASQSIAAEVNNSGVVVGSYQPHAAYWRGYILQNGTFQDFAINGAKNTYLDGINNYGQLGGYYTDKNNRYVAFIASPKAN